MPCRYITKKGKFTTQKTGRRRCWSAGGKSRGGMRGLGTHPGCKCTRRKSVTVHRNGKKFAAKRCAKWKC